MNNKNIANQVLGLVQLSFLILLALRSTTEAFSGLSVYLGPTSINLSVVIVLLMDVIALIYLGLLWIRRQLIVDRLGTILMAWVLSLSPWVYLSALEFGVAGLTGVREWIRLLSLILLYFVVLGIARRTDYEKIINICLLSLAVPLAITYYQIIFSIGQSSSVGLRAFGTMAHPNILAAFLVVMIGLTIWKIAKQNPQGRSWRNRRILWSGLLLLEVPAIIFPISSNGWLMFGVFLLALAMVSRGRRLKITAISIVVAVLAIFILVASQNTNIGKEILQNIQDLGYQNTQSPDSFGTLEGRFQMWGELIDVWRVHPFRGYGLNTTFFVNPELGLAAHNDFLRYLVEGGVFCLLFFVAFQVAVAWQLLRLRRKTDDHQRHLLAGIGFSLVIAWIVGSIGDNVISYTAFLVYFWSILAVVSSVVPVGRPAEAKPSDQLSGYRSPPLFRHWPTMTVQRIPITTRGSSSKLAYKAEASSMEELPRCRRCHTAALTHTDILCRSCFSSLLSPAGFFVVVLLIFLLIGAIGFYLWNKGACLETFLAGWLLLYVILVALLRNQTPRYMYAILSFAMVGFVSGQLLFWIPVRSFQIISKLSIFGLIAVALYGLGASWQTTSHLSRKASLPRFYARHYLLPLGALFGAAYTLNFVLEQSSNFIYGKPSAMVFILTGLVALFVELWLLIWAITEDRWKTILHGLAISYASIIVLIQIGILLTTGVLWTMSKLLPLMSATERFAPLLLERRLGLYTWVTLGMVIAILVIYVVIRRRFLLRQ